MSPVLAIPTKTGTNNGESLGEIDTVTIKAKAKPGAKPFKLTDGKGLYLLVNPNGACYWRRVAETARASLASGIDPSATRKESKSTTVAKAIAETIEATRNARTFQVVAEEWLDKQASKRSDSTMQKARWMLTAFAYPSIGACPIETLKTADLLACLRTLEARGVLKTASRLQQRINAICSYAVACDYMKHNPAANLKGRASHRWHLRTDRACPFRAIRNEVIGARCTRTGAQGQGAGRTKTCPACCGYCCRESAHCGNKAAWRPSSLFKISVV